MERKGRIVFGLILILAFLIGYNGIYKSNLNTIDSIRSQIEEEKKKNDILGNISILDRKLHAYQQRSFSTREATQLLDKVSQMAKKSGIKIEGFNPVLAAETEEYIELPLKIPLSCEYHKLGQFLSLIESNKELIWVKELKMQKATVTGPEEARSPKIDLTVSGLYLKK